jgi:hypothetical protein
MTAAGFPHSDTPGSQLGCQLPRAYRRLQRPSSALDAKASTMCPLQLAKHKHSTKTTKTHTTKTNTHTHHTPPPPQPERQLGTHHGAGDARVHYPEIKQPEINSPHTGPDASEPQQCARNQTTHPHPTFHTHPHTRQRTGSTNQDTDQEAQRSSTAPLSEHHHDAGPHSGPNGVRAP